MRNLSYGQIESLSVLDRFGQLMSNKKVQKICKNRHGILLDAGCGFNATLTKKVWTKFDKVILADVDVSDSLDEVSTQNSKIEIIRGDIHFSVKQIRDNSVDMIIANNLIEHLTDPNSLLLEFNRILRSDGCVYINVPSWTGKFFLELAAFKWNLAPRAEMEDHKAYYSPRELWLLVRKSGFSPSAIRVKRTKFFLNTTLVVNQAN